MLNQVTKSHSKTLISAGVLKTVQKCLKNKWFQKSFRKTVKSDKERDKASKLSWNQILMKPTVVISITAIIGISVGKLLLNPRLIFG